MLVEAGLPYTEAQKIQEFQSCLKDATAIDKSVDSISQVGDDATFQQFYNCLNGKVSAIISISKAASVGKDHLLNQVETKGGRGRGRRVIIFLNLPESIARSSYAFHDDFTFVPNITVRLVKMCCAASIAKLS
jgi:hypothetical protein